MYDIIPDIHGQAEKLKAALTNLGYTDRGGAWRHSDPNRSCIFLGDYIDRGPENGTVIDMVRRMVDAGTAEAIMGNHELNAVHFHTFNPITGEPLRERSDKNLRQHASFLKEFGLGEALTADVISWMKSLPLFLELDDFRAVHACWDEQVIDDLGKLTAGGLLADDQFLEAADQDTILSKLVETTTKGPEAELPRDYFIYDKEGVGRKEVRLQWWNGTASTWRDIAISVPNLSELPDERLPPSIKQTVYPAEAKPVFFGHYWLAGELQLQSPNTLCLDYSAGKEGPLIAYRFLENSSDDLSLANIVGHAGHVDRQD